MKSVSTTNPILVKLQKKEITGNIDLIDSYRHRPGDIDVNDMMNKFNGIATIYT
jgi:hypothetical protein